MQARAAMNLPRAVGLGLRSPHLREFLTGHIDVPWLEVHSENYFGGGAAVASLETLRARYPISLHGVGLGLGSVQPLDEHHLTQLASLVERIQPASVSEHVAWNRWRGGTINDLLPLPYNDETLRVMADKVAQVQDRLRRPILIENVSAYVRFDDSLIEEGEFLAALVAQTGCGLLLDVNNVFVNSSNFDQDPLQLIAALPRESVQEIHIAGHERVDGFLIDTHGAPVCDAVWTLLEQAYARFGPVPTLLERDNHIPALADLLAEVAEAQQRMDSYALAG